MTNPYNLIDTYNNKELSMLPPVNPYTDLHPEGRWTAPANRRVAYVEDRIEKLVSSGADPFDTLAALLGECYPEATYNN